MQEKLRVGVITTTHGLKGECKVFPTTEQKERFLELKQVFLSEKMVPATIAQVKFFKNMVILRFHEFHSIEEIQPYKGADIWIDRKDAIPLAEGEFFLCDVIGCRVYIEENQFLGEVIEVIQTGANDVYVVESPQKKQYLLPAIPSCILSVDVQQKLIQAVLLPGLE